MTQFVLTTIVGGTKVVCADSCWDAYTQLVENNPSFPDNLGVSSTLVLDVLKRDRVGPEGVLLLNAAQRMVGLVRPAGTDIHNYQIALVKYMATAEGGLWVSQLRALPY
jgi:hypothetical protein